MEQRFDINDLHQLESRKSTEKKRRKNKSIGSGYKSNQTYSSGLRLYQNGVKKLEEVERRHKEAQLIKEIEETRDLTFHPKINPISNSFGCQENELPEDNLLKRGMLTKDKIDQMRAEIIYSTQQS